MFTLNVPWVQLANKQYNTLGLVMIQVKAIIILVDACSFYLTSIDDVFVNFRKFYVKETVRRI